MENQRKQEGLVLLALAVALCAATAAPGEQVTVAAIADNTLIDYQDNSSGIGPYVFSGRTGVNSGGIRHRGVFRFDLSVIPAGATITGVDVTLTLVQGGPASGTQTHGLHRLLAAWGEADSPGFGGQGVNAQPGDATWNHTFFPDMFWASPGGDFAATASASRSVGLTAGPLTWSSTPALVADVQAWIDDPQANHGWMVRGNEASLGSSKKFASRENQPCRADIAGGADPFPNDGNVDALDFLRLIAQWGMACPCDADITGPADAPDGVVDSLDYLLLIAQWGSPGRCLDETNAPKVTIEYTTR